LETASFLRFNGTFQYLTGLPSFPDPQTLRRFLHQAPDSFLEQMHRVNDRLLQSFIHQPDHRSRLIFDLDSSVVTVFGRQQKAEVGYNPRYRGKRSYNPLLCLEANSSYLWDTELRPGNAGTWDGSVELMASCFVNVPLDIRELRVRADAGFGFNPVLEILEPLLEVRDLVVHHGQLRALDAISLRVFPGEVYAIIGANGAGKSTLLRTIAGLHHPTTGSIFFDDTDVTGLRPERRAAQGIILVPEGRRLFESLSVEENLQVGATYARPGPWTAERVYEMFGWMRERRKQLTAQLSGGEQQTVAIGRALVANPRVLLLDELSLGLAPVVVQRIYGMLPQILATGLTVLLVEQDVSQALRVASHIHCLLEGRTTLEGRPADVTADQVEAAYFGLAGAASAGRPGEGGEP
jgi:branched-chain amino acid transport system ATP-binding protein